MSILREALLQRGHIFRRRPTPKWPRTWSKKSWQTLGSNEGALAEALRRVSLKLHGLNALAALDVVSGELAAVKNGSPLVLGLNGGSNYLASDQAALLAHTDRLVFVRDGQVVSLRPDRVEVFDAATGAPMRWRSSGSTGDPKRPN